jgi:hypothetical protein
MTNETRKFIASAFMLLLLVGLMGALVFWAIPPANRDLVITILSVLLGAGASAIPNLFGDQKSEVHALRQRISSLEAQQEVLLARYEEVKLSHDRITSMLITRHVISADGISITPNSTHERE